MSAPYTSKYFLRRYLDPPNPPQTPSQQVLGGLGAMFLGKICQDARQIAFEILYYTLIGPTASAGFDGRFDPFEVMAIEGHVGHISRGVNIEDVGQKTVIGYGSIWIHMDPG